MKAYIALAALLATQAVANEPAPTPAPAPTNVETVAAATALPDSVTSVAVPRISCRASNENNTTFRILHALSEKPNIQTLSLDIPNSSRFPSAALDHLVNFPSLTKLHIRDYRETRSPEIFTQVAANKNIRKVDFQFG